MTSSKYYKDYYWHRLDNAAKIFPAVSDVNSTNVFRLTVKLQEEVVKDVLERALEITLEKLPFFNVKLRKGLFWYYFDTNFSKPQVLLDSKYPCGKMERTLNNGFLFKVTYYNKRINFDVFHALTDGTGAIGFLKLLVETYLSLRYPQELLEQYIEDPEDSRKDMDEDSFLRLKSDDIEKENHTTHKAFNITGERLFKSELKVITGTFDSFDIIKLAKEKNTTVTGYLVSVLIKAIYEGSFKYTPQNKNISICVPVNLRSFFGSKTMKNFFSYVNIDVNFHNKDYTFDEIIEIVNKQMKERINKEKLISKIKYNVYAEKQIAIRFVPLFVKNIVLKIIYKKGERGQTTALSNLGVVKIPECFASHIDRFEVLMSVSKTKPIKCSMCTFNNKLCFSFSSGIEETDVQRCFFEFLQKQGIDILITTNEVTEHEEMPEV